MSKAHQFKNAMRVYAAVLINMQHGSFGLQTFKLTFCIYNKLHSHSEILS